MKNLSFSAPGRWLSVVAVCLLTTLFACQDHGISTAPEHGLRLTRTVTSAGRTLVASNYFYDEQKRLTRQEVSNPVTGIASNTLTYFYDGNNRLVRIENVNGLQPGSGNRTLITYNAAGQMQTASFYSLENGIQAATPSSTNEYLYNAAGQLTGYTKRFFPNNQRVEYRYTYTGKNVTQVDQSAYLEAQTNPTGTQQTLYTFDDKLNPYKGLPGYNLDSPFLMINENNIVNPDYTVTYNSQGLPTRIVIPSPIVAGSINFEYEPY